MSQLSPGPVRRYRVPIVVTVVCRVLMIAGCGSSSNVSSPGKTASNLAADGLRFASCMRSHGVSNFPDPNISGGNVSFSLKSTSGIDQASAAFQAAQTVCGRQLPGGGSGSEQPSAATESAMLAISECMRAHRVTGFPDPTTTPPSTPAGYSGVLDRDGVYFAIPTTLNIPSPAVQQAATTCHLGGLGTGG